MRELTEQENLVYQAARENREDGTLVFSDGNPFKVSALSLVELGLFMTEYGDDFCLTTPRDIVKKRLDGTK